MGGAWSGRPWAVRGRGDRGRLSRAGSAVTLEVPRPGRRCLRGAFSVNTTETAPRKPGGRGRDAGCGAGGGSGVTAAPGAAVRGPGHSGREAAVSGPGSGRWAVRGRGDRGRCGGRADRGRRRSRARLSPGLPGRRGAAPAFAQKPENSGSGSVGAESGRFGPAQRRPAVTWWGSMSCRGLMARSAPRPGLEPLAQGGDVGGGEPVTGEQLIGHPVQLPARVGEVASGQARIQPLRQVDQLIDGIALKPAAVST